MKNILLAIWITFAFTSCTVNKYYTECGIKLYQDTVSVDFIPLITPYYEGGITHMPMEVIPIQDITTVFVPSENKCHHLCLHACYPSHENKRGSICCMCKNEIE